MLNKKIEIKLGGVEIPLWFNNFASAELQKMYGADTNTVISKLLERLGESYLFVLSDLIKAGIKGQYFAKDVEKPDYFSTVNEILAEEPDENLLKIWSEVWGVFSEHMGLNLQKSEEPIKDKKKANSKKVIV